MSTLKKPSKSELINEVAEDFSDFINEFLNESTKNKKKNSLSADQKKQRKKLLTWVGHTHTNKKKKVNEGIEAGGESSQKILNVMSKQFKSK